SQRAAAAADAAALAAADTLSGATAGAGADPCGAAAAVAEANGASLRSCALDELTATVRVAVPFAALSAEAAARAGPPPP
ncbi:MAG: helicase, partial [Microbacterium sp.]|uniref:helicase n=1 Tax=Microbacterium sp. TaxID=51671 RepID=UPI0039E5F4EF